MNNYELNSLKLFDLPNDQFFHIFCRTPLEHFTFMTEIRPRIQELLTQWETEEEERPGGFKEYFRRMLSKETIKSGHHKFQWYVPEKESIVKKMHLIILILFYQIYPESELYELIQVGFYFWNIIYGIVVHMPNDVAAELETSLKTKERKEKTSRFTDFMESMKAY